MSEPANTAAAPFLVTVSDPAEVRRVADAIADNGVTVAGVFEVSGVIAIEAAPADLAALNRIPGVRSVEEDKTFSAL